MTLWRRAPREVYRVYGEDEYLSEDSIHTSEEELSPPLVDAQAHASRAGRLIALGLLVGVTVGAIALVASNVSRQHSVPRSDVRHSASASVAVTRWAPATASANRGPAIHVSSGGRPRARVTERPPHAAMLTKPILRQTPLVEPRQIWYPTAAHPESGGAPTPIDTEFDFER
jgi:hypothetical protein